MSEKTKDVVQPEAWYKALPRPIYASLTQLPSADPWFSVYQVKPDVFAIYEGRHFQEVISFLITGTKRALLLDTGMGIGNIKAVVDSLWCGPLTVVNTHSHFDHIGGCEEVHQATGAEVYIHEDDAPMLTSESLSLASNMAYYGFKPLTDWTVVKGDCYINDGDCTFRVLHTPGHSHGSVCYICENENVIFSGDTLFCCSVGRTDFYGSSPERMQVSLKKLYDLEGDYKVYPGHNESTTLEYERNSNPYMKQFRG